jgi:nicotinate-nucleotide pyrophosphorylase (carboxylating)
MRPGSRPALDLDSLQGILRRALAEDIGSGDVTARRVVPENLRARGRIRAKESLVLAGLPVAKRLFRLVDPGLRFVSLARDGERLRKGSEVAQVVGRARSILLAERTALNFLQHLSGIASYTADCVRRAAGRCAVRDTRKTAPGLRALEKYAVRMGGGENHRMGLHDGILIKNNHWRLAGGVSAAVRAAKRMDSGSASLPVQVEVSAMHDLREALEERADAVLLDNLSPPRLRRAVRVARGKAFVEISGGVRLENLETYASLRPDAVSLGALTHSSRWRDLSLSLERLP